MAEIKNTAGETVFTGDSDAECVRWWAEYGRLGDYLQETGEPMDLVVANLDLGE
jgi:hypothetical protein